MRRLLRIGPPLAVVLVLGWFVSCGVLAEVPRAATSEPATQVLDDADLGRHVRAVVRLGHRADRVWRALRDEEYGELCPYLRDAKFEPEPDRTGRLTGHVQGWVGTFPLDARLSSESSLEEYRSTWEATSAEVPVNRGRFVVTPAGTESVVEVSVAAEVRGVPTFFVRLMLRDRLARVLDNLRGRLDRAGGW